MLLCCVLQLQSFEQFGNCVFLLLAHSNILSWLGSINETELAENVKRTVS